MAKKQLFVFIFKLSHVAMCKLYTHAGFIKSTVNQFV